MGLISLRTPEEQRVLFGGTSEVGLVASGLLFNGLLSAFKLLGSVCCMCVCMCADDDNGDRNSLYTLDISCFCSCLVFSALVLVPCSLFSVFQREYRTRFARESLPYKANVGHLCPGDPKVLGREGVLIHFEVKSTFHRWTLGSCV